MSAIPSNQFPSDLAEPLWGYPEAEKFTGLTRRFLWSEMKAGRLTYFKFGTAVRFRADDIRVWLRSRRVDGQSRLEAGEGQTYG